MKRQKNCRPQVSIMEALDNTGTSPSAQSQENSYGVQGNIKFNFILMNSEGGTPLL